MTNSSPLVVLTDHGFADTSIEHDVLESAGCRIRVAQCSSPADVADAAADADVVMVQWAQVTAGVLARLKRCRGIVRLGIGVDNIDLAAARDEGIPVCNVPDYAVDEVADHTMALTLALARQVVAIDARVRDGIWKIVPPAPMPALRDMTFGVVGLGRIGAATVQRARAFRFSVIGCDPSLPDARFTLLGVQRMSLDDVFAKGDVVSLHLPLTPETRHMVCEARLRAMKPTALLINTSRGALVDTTALARALNEGVIAGAGLDVFEDEPLPLDHPIRRCRNALLTSHVAWYSDSSIRVLRQMAAQEAARAARGEPLRNVVNGVDGARNGCGDNGDNKGDHADQVEGGRACV